MKVFYAMVAAMLVLYACSDDKNNNIPAINNIVDHTMARLDAIPQSAIQIAKESLHIAYNHTSHGSQLITGMNALANFPEFADLYSWGSEDDVLDLRDRGIPCSVPDLSQGDSIDDNDVTPWVTCTREFLDDNQDINVIMWSWCSINGHDIDRYLENMEILVEEYPQVTFVFMTGHAEGQGEGGFIHTANEQIRQHCETNNRILFDFADIENYDPDGTYFYDRPMWDNLDYSSDGENRDANWAAEWLAANQGSQLEQLTTGNDVDDYAGCGSCAHSGGAGDPETLNCILKGQAVWWMFAQLAGWEQ